jgi:putative endonuclease
VVAPRQREGFDAEARAETFLGGHGLVPVARNVRFRCGEIDLVMRDGAHWVFVEVRARRDARYGGAAEPTISADGSRLVGMIASAWVVRYRMNTSDPA